MLSCKPLDPPIMKQISWENVFSHCCIFLANVSLLIMLLSIIKAITKSFWLIFLKILEASLLLICSKDLFEIWTGSGSSLTTISLLLNNG